MLSLALIGLAMFFLPGFAAFYIGAISEMRLTSVG